MIDDDSKRRFQAVVWNYYQTHGRHDLPWRQPEPNGSFEPYKIIVSEFMLQQTQVSRVIPKYGLFLEQFPTVSALAAGPLGEVLRAWSGLGYNRRAKFLWQAARQVADEYGGRFPETADQLKQLPGIGTGTAGAVMAYAFNQPAVFVETNIRTVFLHHFFHDQTDVPDRDLLALVEASLDATRPREWYWALMDYGAYLKQTAGNPNHRSATYAKQSRFEGSRRQVRGQVLRLLGEQPRTVAALRAQIPDERLATVLAELQAEGLITKQGNRFSL